MITTIVSLADGAQVYIHTLGRAVRVTAIATSVAEANDYLAMHQGQSVIAQITDGGADIVFMAEYGDKGTRVPPVRTK